MQWNQDFHNGKAMAKARNQGTVDPWLCYYLGPEGNVGGYCSPYIQLGIKLVSILGVDMAIVIFMC